MPTEKNKIGIKIFMRRMGWINRQSLPRVKEADGEWAEEQKTETGGKKGTVGETPSSPLSSEARREERASLRKRTPQKLATLAPSSSAATARRSLAPPRQGFSLCSSAHGPLSATA